RLSSVARQADAEFGDGRRIAAVHDGGAAVRFDGAPRERHAHARPIHTVAPRANERLEGCSALVVRHLVIVETYAELDPMLVGDDACRHRAVGAAELDGGR